MKSVVRYLHAAVAIGLAVFFINSGLKNWTKKLRPVDPVLFTEQIINQGSYTAPVGYNLTMNTLNQNGFLKLIGTLEILAGLLMLLPQLRLGGLVILCPIILNIFLLHVFIDNRPHENRETGILLGLTVLLLIYYKKRLLPLIWKQ